MVKNIYGSFEKFKGWISQAYGGGTIGIAMQQVMEAKNSYCHYCGGHTKAGLGLTQQSCIITGLNHIGIRLLHNNSLVLPLPHLTDSPVDLFKKSHFYNICELSACVLGAVVLNWFGHSLVYVHSKVDSKICFQHTLFSAPVNCNHQKSHFTNL